MKPGTEFTAVYKGEHYHFVAVEHVNVGDSWLCRELDRRLRPGVYSTRDMTDVSNEP